MGVNIMKFQDLTKEQQDHLEGLISQYGQPPIGCTHFDIEDCTSSGFMSNEVGSKSLSYWNHTHWAEGLFYDDYRESLVLLPDPPYYLPESVAFPKSNKPLVQQQAIIQCYLIETFGCSDREALAHSRLIIKEIT